MTRTTEIGVLCTVPGTWYRAIWIPRCPGLWLYFTLGYVDGAARKRSRPATLLGGHLLSVVQKLAMARVRKNDISLFQIFCFELKKTRKRTNNAAKKVSLHVDGGRGYVKVRYISYRVFTLGYIYIYTQAHKVTYPGVKVVVFWMV